MPRSVAVAVAVAGLFWLCAGGCTSSSRPCALEVCDIREASCQQRVAAATACLYGTDTLTVPVNVVPFEEYRALSLEAARQVTPDEDIRFKRIVEGLSLLRLSPTTLTLTDAVERTSWAAAFYSIEDKTITVIDRGVAAASREQVTLLVHEYTHALQDATVGLTPGFAPALNFDASLAARAVAEGEASLVEDFAELGFVDVGPEEVSWANVFSRWHASAREQMRATITPVLLADLFFIYPFGTSLVEGAWSAGGWPAARTLHDMPPVASRQVVAGFAAAEPGGGPWTESLGDESVPVLPPSYQMVLADTMGALVLDSFLAELDRDGVLLAAAPHLRGDVLSIQHAPGSASTVSCWRLRFDDPARAAAVSVRLQGRFRATVWNRDRDVMIILSGTAGSTVIGPEVAFGALRSAAMPAPPGHHAGRITCAGRQWRVPPVPPDLPGGQPQPPDTPTAQPPAVRGS